jgi:peroxiredoxin
MDTVLLIARLLLAFVFAIAAVGKLLDYQGARQAFVDFGLPTGFVAPLAVLLPLAELLVAVILIPASTAASGSLGALVLLGMFIVAIALTLGRGKKPNCHCFGQFHSSPIGWSTLVRNGLLATLAAVVFARGSNNPAIGEVAATAGFNTATWIIFGVAVAALGFAAIEGWFLLNMLAQQGRFLNRLEAAEEALGIVPGTGLRVGKEAPDFELESVTDRRVSLATLRTAGHPVLLLFTNPNCGPCDAFMPAVARWQDQYEGRITIAIISQGSLEENRQKAATYRLESVLVQRDREIMQLYEAKATPSAVLIGADGKIGSPIRSGADEITRLVGETLNEPTLIAEGDSETAADADQQSAAPALGQTAPDFALSDLESTPVSLADFRGKPTLIVFWNPACGFCERLLPQVKAWERRRTAASPQLLVISTGTVEANRALGFRSPVLLDAHGEVMRRFGANGTPMAMLIDASGRIASAMVTGAREVMAIARTEQRETALV